MLRREKGIGRECGEWDFWTGERQGRKEHGVWLSSTSASGKGFFYVNFEGERVRASVGAGLPRSEPKVTREKRVVPPG